MTTLAEQSLSAVNHARDQVVHTIEGMAGALHRNMEDHAGSWLERILHEANVVLSKIPVVGSITEAAEGVVHEGDRLKLVVDAQLAGLKKHLNAETMRFRSLSRDSSPHVRAPAPAFSALAHGILPADIARMKGEWSHAIRARIAEIGTS